MATTPFNPAVRAVQAAGTAVALARALGITSQAVSQWVRAGRIPLSRVVQVSRVTRIPARELSPAFAEAGADPQHRKGSAVL